MLRKCTGNIPPVNMKGNNKDLYYYLPFVTTHSLWVQKHTQISPLDHQRSSLHKICANLINIFRNCSTMKVFPPKSFVKFDNSIYLFPGAIILSKIEGQRLVMYEYIRCTR